MRLLTLLFCSLAGSAAAQDYPSRPVRILVPYGPGGATDIIAHRRGEAHRVARPELHRRKPAGRERQHCPRGGREGRARRLHAAGRQRLDQRHQRDHLRQPAHHPPVARPGRGHQAGRDSAHRRRLPELPNVPTLTEQGFPGIGTNAWQGMFAPAATPKPVVDKLYASVVAVLTKSRNWCAARRRTGGISYARPESR